MLLALFRNTPTSLNISRYYDKRLLYEQCQEKESIKDDKELINEQNPKTFNDEEDFYASDYHMKISTDVSTGFPILYWERDDKSTWMPIFELQAFLNSND